MQNIVKKCSKENHFRSKLRLKNSAIVQEGQENSFQNLNKSNEFC